MEHGLPNVKYSKNNFNGLHTNDKKSIQLTNIIVVHGCTFKYQKKKNTLVFYAVYNLMLQKHNPIPVRKKVFKVRIKFKF